MYFLKLNDNNFEFNTQNKCTISDIAIQEEKDSLKIVYEAANDSRLHNTLRISTYTYHLHFYRCVCGYLSGSIVFGIS
jgi:hypothetical protein